MHDLPVVFGQLLQSLVEDYLQKCSGPFVLAQLGGQNGVSRQSLGHVTDITLGGVVISPLGAHLVQGDDEKQPPQLALFGDVVAAVLRPAKEAAEHRLHDIVGFDAAGEGLGALLARQAAQPRRIAQVDFRGGVLVALLELL